MKSEPFFEMERQIGPHKAKILAYWLAGDGLKIEVSGLPKEMHARAAEGLVRHLVAELLKEFPEPRKEAE